MAPGIVPDDLGADANISQAGTYVVTIVNRETVDAVTMGNALG